MAVRRRWSRSRAGSSVTCWLRGWLARAMSTVGAPLRCVTPSRSISGQTSSGIDLAQADVRAADAGQAPGQAPAVAVEHRQGPEEDRVAADARVEQLTERVEIDATVGVHHPLRPARGAAGVVDGDQVVLTRQAPGLAVRSPAGQELLVGRPGQGRARVRCRRC